MPQYDSTSWSLVLGAAAGQPRDQDEFCRRYEPVIRSFLALRWQVRPNHDRINDAVQEVLMRCCTPGGALERVDPTRSGGFRTYFRGVIRNVALEMERAAKKRGTVQPSDWQLDQVEQGEASPSRMFDRVWAEMITDEAWNLLEERCQGNPRASLRLEALGMRYVDGLPPRVIAAQLSIPDVRDVYQMVVVGRRQFRSALMTVLASHYPDYPARRLEQKCNEVLAALGA